ncbi:MAG: thermopsin family protease [Thermoplasmata archaeon]
MYRLPPGAWKKVTIGLVALVAIMSVAAFSVTPVAGLGGSSLPSASGSTAGPAVSAPPTAGSAPSVTHATNTKAPTLSGRAQQILKTAASHGVPAHSVYLPDLNFLNPTLSQGHVRLTYPGGPAPMGVGEFGLNNTAGTITPYMLNTTSVAGSFAPSNLQVLYFDTANPQLYGVQLNAVDVGVSLFNNPTYQFWTQNVVTYNVASSQLQFENNVWNFSSSALYLSPNVFHAHGPNGTQVGTTFYYAYSAPMTVSYPFSLTLYLNSTLIGGRNAVYFNYSVTDSAGKTVSGSYDYVVFNSLAGTATAAPPSQYQANGYNYNALGLPNDFEMIMGGPGGGSTTNIVSGNATMSLMYWDATTSSYQSVPSAYNVGGETGETVAGAAVSWATGANGMPEAMINAGPSIVQGLWNVSNAVGSSGQTATTLTVTLDPSNAFLFLVNNAGGVNASNAQWAPTASTGVVVSGATSSLTYLLNPGTYSYLVELTGYAPMTGTFTLTAGLPSAFSVALSPSLTSDIYTPLYAFSNAQLGALAVSGSGTASSPYIMPSTQSSLLNASFGVVNDYTYPVFDGVFFVNTTDYTVITAPTLSYLAPFSGVYALFYQKIYGFPTTNNLQMQFFEVQNLKLANSFQITGWASYYVEAYSMPLFSTYSNVLFWNSSGDLVFGNTFNTQSQALILYGGTNDAVISNFINGTVPVAPNPLNFPPFTFPIFGLLLDQNGTTVVNNYFGVTGVTALSPQVMVPAMMPEFSIYTGGYALFTTNNWNLTSVIPAENILGLLGVSGNYWANYGTPANPFGQLYNDSGLITYGGDYSPLTYLPLEPVTFTETGLPVGTAWGVTLNGVAAQGVASAGPSSLVLYQENGTYPFTIDSVSGYGVNVTSGMLVVSGPTTHPVSYAYASVTADTVLGNYTMLSFVDNVTIHVANAGISQANVSLWMQISDSLTGSTCAFASENTSITPGITTYSFAVTPIVIGTQALLNCPLMTLHAAQLTTYVSVFGVANSTSQTTSIILSPSALGMVSPSTSMSTGNISFTAFYSAQYVQSVRVLVSSPTTSVILFNASLVWPSPTQPSTAVWYAANPGVYPWVLTLVTSYGTMSVHGNLTVISSGGTVYQNTTVYSNGSLFKGLNAGASGTILLVIGLIIGMIVALLLARSMMATPKNAPAQAWQQQSTTTPTNQCSVCNRSFMTPEELKDHAKTEHGISS